MTLTAERLRELVHYAPDSGVFTRLITTSNRSKAGTIAGSHRADGYLRICVDGKEYLGHRLAWLYMTGKWPANLVDHRDRDPSNNRWDNLREATYSQNLMNGMRKRDLPRGVSFHRESGRFVAQICANGKSTFLGRFDSVEQAAKRYALAANGLHGKFASGAA